MEAQANSAPNCFAANDYVYPRRVRGLYLVSPCRTIDARRDCLIGWMRVPLAHASHTPAAALPVAHCDFLVTRVLPIEEEYSPPVERYGARARDHVHMWPTVAAEKNAASLTAGL